MLTKSRRAVYFILSFFIMSSLLSPSNAVATDVLNAAPTEFPIASPLLVTAYRTTTSGTDFDFIEIFNTSDAPVNLRDWKISDVVNDRLLQFSSKNAVDYVVPDSHVIISAPAMVINATYKIDGWLQGDKAPSELVRMTTLRLAREGYRTTDVSISATCATQVRTYNTSGYSTAANPFTSGQSRTLFDDGAYISPYEPNGLEVSEVYAYASDCDPFSTDTRCGDYIELHNTSGGVIFLDDLVLRTDSSSSSRTSSNTFTLGGELTPDEYLYVDRTDDGARISLTNSGGYIWLEDMWGLEVPFLKMLTPWPSFSSDQQGLSYSRDDTGAWRWTTAPTPGFVNDIIAPVEVVAACPSGKYRNPDTGKCRAIEEAVSELTACEEGYERSLTTNRCKKVASSTGAALTPCLEGQERNPATNRCRSIASAVAELMPCDEGYERNPTTNRCRKAQSTSVPAAPFAVEPTPADTPVWQWWVGGVILAGIAGYGIWEWRHEIGRFWRRIIKR